MGKGKSDNANDKLSFAFTEDTAKKTGETKRNVQRKTARSKKVAVLPEIVGTSLDKGIEIDALAKLPEAEQHSLAEAAKRGEVSGISALSACDPKAPKTSDGTGKEADRAPTLDPRAWSMSSAQKREAFVKAVASLKRTNRWLLICGRGQGGQLPPERRLPMGTEDCPFKVVRTNGSDEVLARAVNLLIGRAAFETARQPSECIRGTCWNIRALR